MIISKILHPTDFSTNSETALKYACFISTQFSADLYILHIAESAPLMIPMVNLGFPADYFQRQLRHANESLSALPDKVVNHTGNVIRNVYEGKPAEQIIRYANDNAIDMIVMGTHGYTGLEHALLGSVAEYVVRKASCPVLTVHPESIKSTILI